MIQNFSQQDIEEAPGWLAAWMVKGNEAQAKKEANAIPMLVGTGPKQQEMRLEDGLIIFLGAGAALGLCALLHYLGVVTFV